MIAYLVEVDCAKGQGPFLTLLVVPPLTVQGA